jgi:hypothetical protein
MIKIDGLTREQADMLDIIWAFRSKDEYQEWLGYLDTEEYKMAIGLIQLLAIAMIDEDQENLEDPYKDATNVIKQIKSKI